MEEHGAAPWILKFLKQLAEPRGNDFLLRRLCDLQ
jgi:hypothetical protein